MVYFHLYNNCCTTGTVFKQRQSAYTPHAPDAVRALKAVGHSGVLEVKNYINTVRFLAQTDHFVSQDINVSSRAAGFNLDLSVHVFFTLIDCVPIDLHYTTDRLQRLELKSSFVFY